MTKLEVPSGLALNEKEALLDKAANESTDGKINIIQKLNLEEVKDAFQVQFKLIAGVIDSEDNVEVTEVTIDGDEVVVNMILTINPKLETFDIFVPPSLLDLDDDESRMIEKARRTVRESIP